MKGIVQLYHYGKMCTHVHSLQSCLTLGDPVDCSPPSSSVLGILQARILEWAAMPSSRKTLVLAATKLGEPQGDGSDLQ